MGFEYPLKVAHIWFDALWVYQPFGVRGLTSGTRCRFTTTISGDETLFRPVKSDFAKITLIAAGDMQFGPCVQRVEGSGIQTPAIECCPWLQYCATPRDGI